MRGAINGWIVLDIEDLPHPQVVPVQDLGTHYMYDCPCQPIHDMDDAGNIMVVHNAYDGRDEVKH